jgi:hypothetical protein
MSRSTARRGTGGRCRAGTRVPRGCCWRRLAVRRGRAASGPRPRRCIVGAAAAVGGVLAARHVPVEGEAAPARGGCPGDGVAVGQQVPGDAAHLGGVPAHVVLRVAGGHPALVILALGRALGEGEGLVTVQARPGECRERGVPGAVAGGCQVVGRGAVRRLVDGAPLLVGRAVGDAQVLLYQSRTVSAGRRRCPGHRIPTGRS